MAKIEPALTAEEWRDGVYESGDLRVARRTAALDGSPRLDIRAKASPIGSGVLGDPRDLHACAALCLEGQPFGFTREDVEGLRKLARRRVTHGHGDYGPPDMYDRAHGSWTGLDDLADRIEALLPPEE